MIPLICVVTIRITSADLVASFEGPHLSIFLSNDPITVTGIGTKLRQPKE